MEDIKEKSADELFEKLGYEKQENAFSIDYKSTIKAMGETFIRTISFKKKSKLVQVEQLLDGLELKAINKKVEELKW